MRLLLLGRARPHRFSNIASREGGKTDALLDLSAFSFVIKLGGGTDGQAGCFVLCCRLRFFVWALSFFSMFSHRGRYHGRESSGE